MCVLASWRSASPSLLESELLEPEVERKLAGALFNETWRLLDKANRTAQEDTLMVHCAHASRFHWQAVGSASNHAIGEWQISRVYSVVALRESALHHASLCMQHCDKHALRPFMKACAHEAMARALSLSDKSAARIHYQAALDLVPAIEDREERDTLQSDLLTIKL
jgi:hypothetical protein